MTSESETGPGELTITDLAHKYVRAVNDAEAAKEKLLAKWALEFYRPGYLDDAEWERLKRFVHVDDTEHALMQIEIACYRKVVTEHGRASEFAGSWPAKDGVANR